MICSGVFFTSHRDDVCCLGELGDSLLFLCCRVVILSINSPETIESAFQDNRKNASQNTPLIWSFKLIAIIELVGLLLFFDELISFDNSEIYLSLIS